MCANLAVDLLLAQRAAAQRVRVGVAGAGRAGIDVMNLHFGQKTFPANFLSRHSVQVSIQKQQL
jgi:predicted homoserine dehydrogenase-like protein